MKLLTKRLFTLLILFTSIFLLISCKKKELDEVDYSSIWILKREIVMVGGIDICKFQSAVVFLKYNDEEISFSVIYNPNTLTLINQEEINTYKDSYNEDYLKLITLKNKKPHKPYNADEILVSGMKLVSKKVTNNLIVFKFLNDRTDEDLLISEIFIELKRTNYTF